MAKTEHTHKFKRHTFKSGNEVYFCALPDCNKKVAPPFALGKKCICWRCGTEFVLDEYAIRLARPHCNACHRPKDGVKVSFDIETTSINPLVGANPLSSLSERLAMLSKGSDEEDI